MYYFTIKYVVHVVLFSVLPFAVWRSAITCSVCACLAMPDSIVRGTSMKLILSILNYKLEKGLMKCDVWTWCRCAPGYYGNPVVIGSTCQPCHCNGNSDPNMLFSDCHPLTGECQSCMHNTAGPHCEICAPGYYGDAITAKNCTRMNTFSVYQDWDLVFRYYHQVSHDFLFVYPRMQLFSVWHWSLWPSDRSVSLQAWRGCCPLWPLWGMCPFLFLYCFHCMR